MKLDDARVAFEAGDFQRIADAVDTGLEDPETSRALIVFNTSAEPISGSVVFNVDMPWREGKVLPELRVSRSVTRKKSRHSIRNLVYSANRLRFALWFDVEQLPDLGWETYIAAYVTVEDSGSVGEALLPAIPQTSYSLVETRRHIGTLPPMFDLRSIL